MLFRSRIVDVDNAFLTLLSPLIVELESTVPGVKFEIYDRYSNMLESMRDAKIDLAIYSTEGKAAASTHRTTIPRSGRSPSGSARCGKENTDYKSCFPNLPAEAFARRPAAPPDRRKATSRFLHGGSNPFGPGTRIPAGKTILLARRREHPRLVPAE